MFSYNTNKDINSIIQDLNLFAGLSTTNMIVSYITKKLRDLDSLSSKELSELVQKLDQWKNNETIKDVKIDDLSFVQTLQKASEQFKDKAYDSIITENITIRLDDHTKKIYKELTLTELTAELQNGICNDMNSITLGFKSDKNFNLYLSYVIDLLIKFPITKPLTISFLRHMKINTSGVFELARYLQSGKSPNKTKLLFNNNKLDDQSIKYLKQAIVLGNTNDNLALHLYQNDISDAGITEICDIIKSGQLKKGFTMVFDEKKTSPPNMSHRLAGAIKTGHAPKYLTLAFNEANSHKLGSLIKCIAAGDAPSGFTLDLHPAESQINGDLGLDIANALRSEKIPDNFQLSIRTVESLDHFIELLIDALSNTKNTSKMTISFNNFILISEQTLNLLIDFFKSTKFPKNCQFKNLFDHMVFFPIKTATQKALASALMLNTSIQISTDTFNSIPDLDKKQAGKDVQSMEIIRLCSLRNKLLLDYPQYEGIIKKECQKVGLYDPAIHGIGLPSLKSTIVCKFFRTKDELENYDEVVDSLPPDIKRFINDAQAVSHELSIMKKPVPEPSSNVELAEVTNVTIKQY